MAYVGLGWVDLDSVWVGWVGFGLVGLDWVGFGWIGLMKKKERHPVNCAKTVRGDDDFLCGIGLAVSLVQATSTPPSLVPRSAFVHFTKRESTAVYSLAY